MADWSRQRQARFAQSKPAVGAQNPRSLVLVMSMKWRVLWSLQVVDLVLSCTEYGGGGLYMDSTELYGGYMHNQKQLLGSRGMWLNDPTTVWNPSRIATP